MATEQIVVGIDPGLSKCGYAVVTSSGTRLALEIVPTAELTKRLERDVLGGAIHTICVGNATKSAMVVEMIRERWPQMPVVLVDERNTSLQARYLYYEDHPPRGLARLIPRGLLVPKQPIDGYAALLIVDRYRQGLRGPRQA